MSADIGSYPKIYTLAFVYLIVLYLVNSDNHFPALDALKSRTPNDVQRRTVENLIKRKLPRRYSEFKIFINPNLGPKQRHTFKLITNLSSNVVTIEANNGVAASWGFKHFLSQYVDAHFSWDGDRLSGLPKKWPDLGKDGIVITSNDSYSYSWYDWLAWEKHIDWLALNGINLPLAIGGQEEIWKKVFIERLELMPEEVDDYFTGPAFLAWNRMGNIRKWAGRLPSNWTKEQIFLQHKILERMRNFSMIPILPAFSGFIPDAIQWLYPHVKTHRLPKWNQFNSSYSGNLLLDSSDPLFGKIGMAFLEEYTKEFGTDHIYSADTFNEMSYGDSDFIASYGKAVFDAMTKVDEKSVWAMQGWIFQDTSFWTQDRAKAILTSVPTGRMLVLDLYAEEQPRFKTYHSFYGQPFIWCMLHNFGGRSSFYGAVDRVNKGPLEVRHLNNISMVGIGLSMEAINQNWVIYELMLEHTWVNEERNLSNWSECYAKRRYGTPDPKLHMAWLKLLTSIYNFTVTNRLKNHVFTDRPNLHPGNNYWYCPQRVVEAWDLFIEYSFNAGSYITCLFAHDLVDLTRQVVETWLSDIHQEIVAAYQSKDMVAFLHLNHTLISALIDLDRLLGSDRNFLLGRWIKNARSSTDGSSDEKDLFEFNARNQITLWGPSGNVLDYAAKQWSGLIKSYYMKRWRLFTEELITNWNKSFDQNSFNEKVFNQVELPFNYEKTIYHSGPIGDPVVFSQKMHKKYRILIDYHC